MTRLVLLLGLVVGLPAEPMAGGLVQSGGAPTKAGQRYAGRRLSDALRTLQDAGLELVFSSELVTREMRVQDEPRATSLREILDELLAPHGLVSRPGPGGKLLVVRAGNSLRRPLHEDRAKKRTTGAISGTVVDARTATPIPGVLIERQGMAGSVLTDRHGEFTLDDVPAGEQTLYVSLVGYTLARPVVDVTAGGRAVVTIPLAEGTGAYTERLTVSAETEAASTRVAPVVQMLTSAGLQDLRGVLADDPFRAVQALPGVASTDDFRSEFSVRGSDFAHLGLSVDGVPSRWLVHAVQGVEDTGSISMLNGDVLDRLSLFVGAYPQRFGDRTGAWLEAELREDPATPTRSAARSAEPMRRSWRRARWVEPDEGRGCSRFDRATSTGSCVA